MSEIEGYTLNNRTGSVVVRGVAKAAWMSSAYEVSYKQRGGDVVTAGPAVRDTYASKGSVTDNGRRVVLT